MASLVYRGTGQALSWIREEVEERIAAPNMIFSLTVTSSSSIILSLYPSLLFIFSYFKLTLDYNPSSYVANGQARSFASVFCFRFHFLCLFLQRLCNFFSIFLWSNRVKLELYDQMVGMGFAKMTVAAALRHTNNDLHGALRIIQEQPELLSISDHDVVPDWDGPITDEMIAQVYYFNSTSNIIIHKGVIGSGMGCRV